MHEKSITVSEAELAMLLAALQRYARAAKSVPASSTDSNLLGLYSRQADQANALIAKLSKT